MANRTLRHGDGLGTKSHLRNDVRRLQRLLAKAGHTVKIDGLFGRGTEKVVKAFQRSRGLGSDGVVGRKTWAELDSTGSATKRPPRRPVVIPTASSSRPTLKGFRGDFQWVHAREGHAGKSYWPGGASGVTLDPGVDLGHAKPALIAAAYKKLLTPERYAAVRKVLGVKGQAAKKALTSDPVLKSIRISRKQADAIFHLAARPYWEAIVDRFPTLAERHTPSSVHTVMLSLSYNRGARNRGLEGLRPLLEAKDWVGVARKVGSMQQNHKLAGIRTRRRMEANLIQRDVA